jgi:4-hydroxy-tetrahydrodipicolinate synthase
MGVISVMANIIPAKTSKIVKDYLKGSTKESMELQIELGDLIRALFSDVNPIPLKEAMNLMGMDVGLCRPPLVEMSPSGRERMKKTLIKYDLLQGD